MYYIGIDPGINGAVVILNDKGKYKDSFTMPTITTIKNKKKKNEVNAVELFNSLKSYQNKSKICIEQVHAIANQGLVSAFSFGFTFGQTFAIANLIDNNISLISPAKWQNHLHKIYFDEKISKALSIYNYDKISKTIKNNDFKEFYKHISNLKSTKYTKLETAYLYYLIDNKLSINYKNDNLVDAFCIAHYNYLLSTTPEL